uniref:Uncharacterized protein n=1 Tax=Anguilla anguilla TaxID=7936 RepID=A0A0E9SHI8_ANGAN
MLACQALWLSVFDEGPRP